MPSQDELIRPKSGTNDDKQPTKSIPKINGDQDVEPSPETPPAPKHNCVVEWLISTKADSGKQNFMVWYLAIWEITFAITAYTAFVDSNATVNHFKKLLAWPLIDCIFTIQLLILALCKDLDAKFNIYKIMFAEGLKFLTIIFSYRVLYSGWNYWWALSFAIIWLLFEGTMEFFSTSPYRYYHGNKEKMFIFQSFLLVIACCGCDKDPWWTCYFIPLIYLSILCMFGLLFEQILVIVEIFICLTKWGNITQVLTQYLNRNIITPAILRNVSWVCVCCWCFFAKFKFNAVLGNTHGVNNADGEQTAENLALAFVVSRIVSWAYIIVVVERCPYEYFSIYNIELLMEEEDAKDQAENAKDEEDYQKLIDEDEKKEFQAKVDKKIKNREQEKFIDHMKKEFGPAYGLVLQRLFDWINQQEEQNKGLGGESQDAKSQANSKAKSKAKSNGNAKDDDNAKDDGNANNQQNDKQ